MHAKRSVTFKARSWQMAADLYLPDGFDEGQRHPAVVIVHPVGSCKEQSPAIYAPRLAETGFIVLAFDASFQGDSGGEPRHVETPTERVEDVRCAVDYLMTLDYVDEERVGVLGICAGGGFAVSAATMDPRIRAVTTITGINNGNTMREGFAGKPADVLAQAAKQRTAEARSGRFVAIDLLPPSPEAGAAQGITDTDLMGAIEFYKTDRGRQPHGLTTVIFSRYAAYVAWDAFHFAELFLTQPLLVIVGDNVGVLGAYRDGFELIRRAASNDKELVVLKGVSHYDLYDQPAAVDQALSKAIPFFKRTLERAS